MYSMSTSQVLNPGIGTDTQYWYRYLRIPDTWFALYWSIFVMYNIYFNYCASDSALNVMTMRISINQSVNMIIFFT